MSQKFRSFAKGNGCVLDSNQNMPLYVKRAGYLRKLKKMKRRFFVLHMESETGAARLEYYNSERKWKSGCEPKRSIELKSCLNISRKLHSKQKNVIALYTEDDCFSIVTETAEELELWLNDILEVQKTFIDGDENGRGCTVYEHLWQVVIDKHDLEYDRNLSGPYRVALSSNALTLIKMSPSNENDILEFPLMSIRRCGHSKDHFFIELGRSAVTGAGEIYMATEATIIAQNMHETVLSAMKSSKIRENGNLLPRPRSASTSENSNPVVTRRPIGIVTPQSVSSVTISSLSNSRERCDSLPTRPKTISENSHTCVLSVLSSPHSSSGFPCKRLNSRPHSMYEWPSFNSPSTRSSSFSPCSGSSTTANTSSNEDVDNTRQPSLSFSHSVSNDGSSLTDRVVTAVPDGYLMMSHTKENKQLISNCMSMNKSDGSVSTSPYIDMRSLSSAKSAVVKKLGASSNSDETSRTEGSYLEMSSSCSTDSACAAKSPENSFLHDSKDESGHLLALEKVSSLLKVEESDERMLEPILRNTVTDGKEQLDSKVEPSSLIPSIPSNEMQVNKICSDTNLYSAKPPPIPERTYCRIEAKNVCPPLPSRNARNISEKVSTLCDQSRRELDIGKFVNTISIQQKCNISESGPDINRSQQTSDCSEYAVSSFVENNLSHKASKVSPDQNREFICPVHGDRCKSNMSINKVSNNQPSEFKMTIMKALHSPAQNHKNLASRYSFPENVCNEIELQLHNKRDSLTANELPENSQYSLSLVPESENQNLTKISESISHSLDDYVNLEFKKPALPVTNKNFSAISSIHKSNFQLMSNPFCPVDASYSNIQFGKPYCPTPNPVPATCEIAISSFNSSLKSEKLTKSDRSVSPSYTLNSTSNNASDDAKEQKIQQSPTCSVNYSTDSSKNSLITPKLKNIPNTLPAFRKQMSAPAASSLRPELPSPGRKSSCPVTASASMIKSPLPVNAVSSIRPMHLQSHGTVIGHLRVSTSRSPDHSSVSSISSASDELSSNHSSPKVLSTFQNFGTVIRQNIPADNQYENVVIPQKPSTSSRPSSVSSEKELNYASLDLTPASGDDAPRSPSMQKSSVVQDEESLMYAEIDFTKSEGLKNISGSVREGRL
ncbi:insulin receptor substrate 1-like isoform X2 [Stegodyphus dumicola]|uniref:insulin receptor substrate 1-like isoform X2 n=1 Tax=Stegodyphus dumicola TaxID=202533 RepID=UPI0015B17231|nr:insulin receptor substrate 1-like isoform X2 [Stegodyphus dumicola]